MDTVYQLEYNDKFPFYKYHKGIKTVFFMVW